MKKKEEKEKESEYVQWKMWMEDGMERVQMTIQEKKRVD